MRMDASVGLENARHSLRHVRTLRVGEELRPNGKVAEPVALSGALKSVEREGVLTAVGVCLLLRG